VGTATPVLGAAILDTDHRRGPLLNSVTAFLGLTAGALGAAASSLSRPIRLHLVMSCCSRHGSDDGPAVRDAENGDAQGRRVGVATAACSVPRQSRAALLRIMRQHCGLGVRRLLPFADATVVATTLGVRAPWVGGIVVAAPWLSAR